jgi:hypothetical protein
MGGPAIPGTTQPIKPITINIIPKITATMSRHIASDITFQKSRQNYKKTFNFAV